MGKVSVTKHWLVMTVLSVILAIFGGGVLASNAYAANDDLHVISIQRQLTTDGKVQNLEWDGTPGELDAAQKAAADKVKDAQHGYQQFSESDTEARVMLVNPYEGTGDVGRVTDIVLDVQGEDGPSASYRYSRNEIQIFDNYEDAEAAAQSKSVIAAYDYTHGLLIVQPGEMLTKNLTLYLAYQQETDGQRFDRGRTLIVRVKTDGEYASVVPTENDYVPDTSGYGEDHPDPNSDIGTKYRGANTTTGYPFYSSHKSNTWFTTTLSSGTDFLYDVAFHNGILKNADTLRGAGTGGKYGNDYYKDDADAYFSGEYRVNAFKVMWEHRSESNDDWNKPAKHGGVSKWSYQLRNAAMIICKDFNNPTPAERAKVEEVGGPYAKIDGVDYWIDENHKIHWVENVLMKDIYVDITLTSDPEKNTTNQQAPKPVKQSVTDSSITLKAQNNMMYGIYDWTTGEIRWQTSNKFSGLPSGQHQTFFQAYKMKNELGQYINEPDVNTRSDWGWYSTTGEHNPPAKKTAAEVLGSSWDGVNRENAASGYVSGHWDYPTPGYGVGIGTTFVVQLSNHGISGLSDPYTAYATCTSPGLGYTDGQYPEVIIKLTNFDEETGNSKFAFWSHYAAGGTQQFYGTFELAGPPTGEAYLEKTSTNEASINNPYYTFEGIKYGLFASEEDARNETNMIQEIELSSSGTAGPFTVNSGTYFMKELETNDFYEKNDEIISHHVPANGTATFSFADEPKYVKLNVKKEPINKNLAEATQIYNFEGTKFILTNSNGRQILRDSTEQQLELVIDAENKAGTSDWVLIDDYTLVESETEYNKNNTRNTITYSVSAEELIEVANNRGGYQNKEYWFGEEFKNDEGQTVGKSVPEGEKYMHHQLTKHDATTTHTTPQGDGRIKGTQFTVKYYDGHYNTLEELSGKTAIYTWVIETDENGIAKLDNAHKVSGSPVFLVDKKDDNIWASGTYEWWESKAAEGYHISDTKHHVIDVDPINDFPNENKSDLGNVNHDVYNQVWRGDIKVIKADDDFNSQKAQGRATLAGAVFEIINRSEYPVVSPVSGQEIPYGGVVCTIVTDQNGVASTQKSSLALNNQSWADHTAWGEWRSDTFIVNNNGSATTEKTVEWEGALAYGQYEVREIKAPEGYLLNLAWRGLAANPENDGFNKLVAAAKADNKADVEIDPYASNSADKWISKSKALVEFTGAENWCRDQVFRSGITIGKIDRENLLYKPQGSATLEHALLTIYSRNPQHIFVPKIDEHKSTEATFGEVAGWTDSGRDKDYGNKIMTIETIKLSKEDGTALYYFDKPLTITYYNYLTEKEETYTFDSTDTLYFAYSKTDRTVDKNGYVKYVWNAGKSAEEVIQDTVKDYSLPYGDYYINEVGYNDGEPTTGYMYDIKSQLWGTHFSVGIVNATDPSVDHTTYNMNGKETGREAETEHGNYVDLLDSDEAVSNQVGRFDIKIYKTKYAGNKSEPLANVPFRVTSNTTGESHILVTDENGAINTNSFGSNKLFDHTEQTNINDKEILKERSGVGIPLSTVDWDNKEPSVVPTRGTWYNGRVDAWTQKIDNTRGAFPFDTYTITELPCKENEGLELVEYTLQVDAPNRTNLNYWSPDSLRLDVNSEHFDSRYAFEVIFNGTGIKVFESPDNIDGELPQIGTTLVHKDTGTHTVPANTEVDLIDKIKYTDLVPGENYYFKGELRLVETDEEGNKIAGEVLDSAQTEPFKCVTSDGEFEMPFKFNTKDLDGRSVVAFEELIQITEEEGEKPVAEHKDPTDPGQTVNIPRIGTTLTDKQEQNHISSYCETIKLVDTVEYENLTPNETYTFVGTLYYKNDKDEAIPVKNDKGEVVTSTQTYTPLEANGTVDIPFEFTIEKEIVSTTIVAFEEVTPADSEIKFAVHADIKDSKQTVFIPEIHTNAMDKETMRHDGYAPLDGDVTIVDKVTYKDLAAGKEYDLKAKLMDKATGQPIQVDGQDFEKTVQFVAGTEEDEPNSPVSGEVEVELTLPANVVSGKKTVVFEYLYLVGNTEPAATHTDINDEGQTVEFIEITGEIDKRQSPVSVEKPDYEYSIDYRSTSSTWADELVMQDTLDCAIDRLADMTYIKTPVAFDDWDGQINVWYQTNKTDKEDDADANKYDAMKTNPDNPNFAVKTYDAEGKLVSSVPVEDARAKRMTNYVGWKLWKADVSTMVSETLYVEDLKLDEDEYIVAIRIEHGRVEEGFTTRSADNELWNEEREERYGENDTLEDGIITRYPETFDMSKAANEELRTGKDGVTVFNFEPVIIGMTLTEEAKAKAGEEITIANTAEMAIYRDGGGKEVRLQDDDKDKVVQTIKIPRIGTQASVGGAQAGVTAGGEVHLVDVVSYENLKPGTKYVLKGVLMDKATNQPVTHEGQEVTAEAELIPETANGTANVEFVFNAREIAYHETVVFEKLFLVSTPVPEAEPGKVNISKTDVATSGELPGAELTVKDSEGKIVESWISTDKPHVMELAAGEYTLIENRAPLGYAVAEEVKFTVNENGEVEGGHVFMEDAPESGVASRLIAAHEDINDEGQTVRFGANDLADKPKANQPQPINKTGEDSTALMLASAMFAVLVSVIGGVATRRIARKKA